MRTCPVCRLAVEDVQELARHLVGEATGSDVAHVMWLNRNVTKHKVGVRKLATLLEQGADGPPSGETRVAR